MDKVHPARKMEVPNTVRDNSLRSRGVSGIEASLELSLELSLSITIELNELFLNEFVQP